jgi:hypothetical protein
VATPVWSPLAGRFGWSEEYFARVAAACDQVCVMGYDTGLYLPRAYVWFMREQTIHVTRAVARSNPRRRVLIGVPTYGRGGLSHHAYAENLRMALKGVREGLASPATAREVFAGVAPFADYTTQLEEWDTYRELWLNGSRAAGEEHGIPATRSTMGTGPDFWLVGYNHPQRRISKEKGSARWPLLQIRPVSPLKTFWPPSNNWDR